MVCPQGKNFGLRLASSNSHKQTLHVTRSKTSASSSLTTEDMVHHALHTTVGETRVHALPYGMLIKFFICRISFDFGVKKTDLKKIRDNAVTLSTQIK